MLIDTISGLRTDESFHMFWTKVVRMAESLGNVDDSELPRQRKTPRRLDDGGATNHFHMHLQKCIIGKYEYIS